MRKSMFGCLLAIALFGTAPLVTADDVSCVASSGECMISGYYDYDPKKLEVGVVVSPYAEQRFTTTIFLPEGRQRRQLWDPAVQSSQACQTQMTCQNGAVLSCYANPPCGGGSTSDALWCGEFGAAQCIDIYISCRRPDFHAEE